MIDYKIRTLSPFQYEEIITKLINTRVNPPIFLDNNAQAAYDKGYDRGYEKAQNQYRRVFGKLCWWIGV